MKTSEAPTIQSPAWNQYRRQIIASIADVEVLMSQLNKSLNAEGLALEVAGQLGFEIDTADSFKALEELVKATRTIAIEGLRLTCQGQGGQFRLGL